MVMNTDLNSLDVYRQLAEWHESRGQASMRDRFLVLAADSAMHAGLAEEAEMLRQRLLQANPHHLLKPYRSFAEALQIPDVQVYVQDLRINYPLEVAEDLLHSLRASAETEAGQEPTEPQGPINNDTTLPLDLPVGPASRRSAEHPGEGLKVYPLRETEAPQPPPKKTAPPSRPTPAKIPAPRPAPVAHAPGSPKAPAARPAAPGPVPRPMPASPPQPTAPLPRRIPASPPAAAHAARTEASPFFAAAGTEEPEAEAPRGVWLTLILLGIVGTAGLVLALYTFARPFWPSGWPPRFPAP
jgi:hypothetical protein